MEHAVRALEDVNVTEDKPLLMDLTKIEAYEGNVLHPTVLRKLRAFIQHIFCACISNL
jgi:hypothetical protein